MRTMKVGGNTSFTDFLSKNAKGSLNSSSTAKDKYTSKAADLYKDELKRRAKEDEAHYGAGIVVADGAVEASAGKSDANGKANGGAGGDDDDFFDTWDKPSNIISPTPKVPSGPPRLGFSPAITPNASRSTTPSIPPPSSSSPLASPSAAVARAVSPPVEASPPPAPAPAASRAVSSASLKPATGSIPRAGGAMKLGATKGKLGGVKKGGAAINFEEAERKAKEEEERIKRLGYDREQEEKAAAEAAAASARNAAASRSAGSASSSRGEMIGNKKSAGEMERLGMGFGRLGFGQTAGLSGEEAAKQAVAAKKAAARASSGYVEPEESTYARDKFSSSKGISSDMYFGRNAYDPQARAEAQSKLQQFQGATAISSNAYFGREEDDFPGQRSAADESILNVESLSDLERTAKDAARKLMNQYGIEDFSDVQNAIRNGAMSVSRGYSGQIGPAADFFPTLSSCRATWPMQHSDTARLGISLSASFFLSHIDCVA